MVYRCNRCNWVYVAIGSLTVDDRCVSNTGCIGVMEEVKERGGAKCGKCQDFNEYQSEPYTCYRCRSW